MKSKIQPEELGTHRRKMFELFDLVPETGCYVPYLGLKLKVYPSVFWPHEDSYALANNYRVNQGETVLDVCSGSGNLAILSALKGAKRVVGLEHNPNAVKAARENAREYHLEKIADIRQSDMFSTLKEGEIFDVVTANLPFTKKEPANLTETSMYDESLTAHIQFFFGGQNGQGIKDYLKTEGRIYMAHSDIGAMDRMLEMADTSGLKSKKIGEYIIEKPHIVFSAFELRRKR